jgi:hypothetical protein
MPCLPRAPEQSSGNTCREHKNCRRHDDRPTACRGSRSHTRRGPSHCSVSTGHRHDEPIPASRQRLDKSRVIGGIAERFPQLIDRRIQAVVEIHEGVGRPALIAKFFACDHFARPLQQDREDLKGLLLQSDPYALLAHLSSAHVHLERSEPQD